ncbi:hypothetical protein BEWA_050080 [Theileria equi strain WA]|uniref:Uncharacterized protein n=1 Tax=Theileria equi strain WA TaxID=1537102 RepID=L1LB91_THEEQ|nr:hypothetical protein BEWA_050080 [Theileria equi strain WA]EKX72540.1 hypothetical protein BEWA_050080 [Theileria equi strain WA]|eukprot:XP_004831992.1 hypothetical protein BEWA_050080 [Theileria equi strain WA]
MNGGGNILHLNVYGRCGENGDRQCKCGSGNLIAEKKPNTPVTGFTCYTHGLRNGYGNTFTLNNKLQDGGKIIEVRGLVREPISGVKKVSVYYWDQAETKPLLLEVKYGGGTTIYYAKDNNGGSNWNFIFQSQSSKELEEKLDELVCLHHNAVTINLSKGLSTGGQHNYCCSGNHGQKVSVTPVKVSCNKQGHQRHFKYYKHEVNTSSGTGIKLAAIKYYVGGNSLKNRNNITLSGQSISDVKSVYAFYCSENDPVLIYVDSPGQGVNGWYKKGNSDSSGNEEWTKVPDLREITHRNLDAGTLNHEQYNQLVGALIEAGCTSYKECPAPTAPLSTSSDDSTPASPAPGTAEKFVFEYATGLGVIVSSVFGGSGLTGFLGYKGYKLLKNSRDPWVRQI